jgi:hypothetical protein
MIQGMECINKISGACNYIPLEGNLSNKLASYLVSCGQLSVVRIGLSASDSFCTASATFPSRPLRISGAAELTTWNARHMALLPSSRVSALKTPPVKSAMSTPVKVLGSPVLPPILARYGRACSAPRASAVNATSPYSSPIARRYHCNDC